MKAVFPLVFWYFFFGNLLSAGRAKFSPWHPSHSSASHEGWQKTHLDPWLCTQVSKSLAKEQAIGFFPPKFGNVLQIESCNLDMVYSCPKEQEVVGFLTQNWQNELPHAGLSQHSSFWGRWKSSSWLGEVLGVGSDLGFVP